MADTEQNCKARSRQAWRDMFLIVEKPWIKAALSFLGTMTPVSGVIISALAPASKPITGVPHARLSAKVNPYGSSQVLVNSMAVAWHK